MKARLLALFLFLRKQGVVYFLKCISRIRLVCSSILLKKPWAILVKHSTTKCSIASLAVYNKLFLNLFIILSPR